MVVKILQIAKGKAEKETTPEELKKKTFIKFHIQENRGIHSNNHFGSKDKQGCKRWVLLCVNSKFLSREIKTSEIVNPF